MKRLFAAALVGILSLSSGADRAQAATFHPSLVVPVDFGDVAIGQTKSMSFSLSWSLDVGDVLEGLSLSKSGTSSVAFGMERITKGCTTEGGICDFVLSFMPTSTGFQTAFKTALRLDLESGKEKFLLQLQGTGVAASTRLDNAPAPVPVPASLPLLAAGLGVMGLIRRKKRSA